MHATQAAVSQRIAALEHELGTVLVDRSAWGLKLTPVGGRVLQHAERLLALEKELRLTARPDASPAGRVRVGVIESVVHTWLAEQVRALARHFPDIDPDFTVDTARNLRDQFRQHRLDVLIQTIRSRKRPATRNSSSSSCVASRSSGSDAPAYWRAGGCAPKT